MIAALSSETGYGIAVNAVQSINPRQIIATGVHHRERPPIRLWIVAGPPLGH
jgi:hypothetical protein